MAPPKKVPVCNNWIRFQLVKWISFALLVTFTAIRHPSQEGKTIGFANASFGGSATAFPPLKFQHKVQQTQKRPGNWPRYLKLTN